MTTLTSHARSRVARIVLALGACGCGERSPIGDPTAAVLTKGVAETLSSDASDGPETLGEGSLAVTSDSESDATTAGPSCGDGVVDGAEECDDGNTRDDDACLASCQLARCGDGHLRPDVEACDDGNTRDDDACTSACEHAICGDGLVYLDHEQCDDGGDSESCDADCTTPACGDGHLNQTAGEQCDDGDASPACDDDCTPAACGDGLVNAAAGEQCDAAGESETCDADCSAAVCGDGHLNQTAGEQCDDGNSLPDDGCVDCQLPPKWSAVGPRVDIPADELDGWEECWSGTYGQDAGDSVATILASACTRAHLMLACRPVGSDVFSVLAHAPRGDVTAYTGDGDTTHVANGVAWYYAGGSSWGFADALDSVDRSPCDIELADGPRRLCWNTDGGAIAPGFRCGATLNLNGNNSWQRVILHAY